LEEIINSKRFQNFIKNLNLTNVGCSVMDRKIGSALILIILGLIIIAFPVLGIVPFSVMTGLALLFLGVGFIAIGITTLDENTMRGIVVLTLGVLALILGLGFIYNPSLFSFVAAIFVFIAGLFLIISGIVAIISRLGGNIWTGLFTTILGIIYLILAIYVANPFYYGLLIGLWLLITGILMLFEK
jgi:membrane protein HdeD